MENNKHTNTESPKIQEGQQIPNIQQSKGQETKVGEEKWKSGLDVLGDGGIIKVIKREGSNVPYPEGEEGATINPPKDAQVSVHYVGTLLDGTKFDSSRDRDEPFKFKLGAGSVIKGWDEGVATMKRGELAEFILRSDYAYGKAGSPPKIPADATLIFEVELLDWDTWEDLSSSKKPNTLFKRTIKSADESEWKKPSDGTKCKINYVLRVGDKEVERKEAFEFTVGEEHVHRSLECACEELKKGEKALFKLHPTIAYGSEGCKEKQIPPNSVIFYEIEMLEFEKERERWELNEKEKMQEAEMKKNVGNQFFKQQKYQAAAKKYEKALSYVEFDHDFTSEEEKAKAKASRTIIRSNLAASQLKVARYRDALENCSKVLEDDSKNVKALFRRGMARKHLAEYEDALKDLEYALTLDQSNKELQREIQQIKAMVRKQKQKDKKVFSRMFSALDYGDVEVKKEKKNDKKDGEMMEDDENKSENENKMETEESSSQ